MLDNQLRHLKDRVFNPLCGLVPASISPLLITFIGFIAGLASCFFASTSYIRISLFFWLANRAFDCLDGALARYRKIASDLGGFLDLLCDFIIYSVIPIAVAVGADNTPGTLLAVACLEASFHVNNFILFYVAALVEKAVKKDEDGKAETRAKELTSVAMKPALIEGFESGVLFTLMLAFPGHIRLLSIMMSALVSIGVMQRILWVVSALR